jgi:hypothetical protein
MRQEDATVYGYNRTLFLYFGVASGCGVTEGCSGMGCLLASQPEAVSFCRSAVSLRTAHISSAVAFHSGIRYE